ncbi:MAG: hypothetical protein NTV34_14055 [Proteobacteria bacterium]|nr:hypothetical protein [Pseudomonadota bacterium]
MKNRNFWTVLGVAALGLIAFVLLRPKTTGPKASGPNSKLAVPQSISDGAKTANLPAAAANGSQPQGLAAPQIAAGPLPAAGGGDLGANPAGRVGIGLSVESKENVVQQTLGQTNGTSPSRAVLGGEPLNPSASANPSKTSPSDTNPSGISVSAPSASDINKGSAGSETPKVSAQGVPDSVTGQQLMSVPGALKAAKESALKDDATRKAEKASSDLAASRALASDSKKAKDKSLNSASPTPNGSSAVGSPAPLITPDEGPKATVPKESCEEQWKQYLSDMVYMTSMSSQKPLAADIATSHIETIKQSSTSAVMRDIAFTSDHPTGALLLTSLGIPTAVNLTRESYLTLCKAAGGRAAGSILFNISRLKLKDISDDRIKVGAGTYQVYKMKIEVGVNLSGKTVSANMEIWMAKSRPGLVVKQNIKFPASVFPEHGNITFTSQLAGGRKI